MSTPEPPSMDFCGLASTTSLQYSRPYDIMLITEVLAASINPAKGKSTSAQWETVVKKMNEQLVKQKRHVGLLSVKKGH